MASGYRLLFDATSFNNRRQRTEMGLCYMDHWSYLHRIDSVGRSWWLGQSFAFCILHLQAPDRGDAPPIPPSIYPGGYRRRASLIPGGYPLYPEA